jgi:hypothetical protein
MQHIASLSRRSLSADATRLEIVTKPPRRGMSSSALGKMKPHFITLDLLCGSLLLCHGVLPSCIVCSHSSSKLQPPLHSRSYRTTTAVEANNSPSSQSHSIGSYLSASYSFACTRDPLMRKLCWSAKVEISSEWGTHRMDSHACNGRLCGTGATITHSSVTFSQVLFQKLKYFSARHATIHALT